jgi:hypothetical protein
MDLSSEYIDQVWLFLKMKLNSFKIAFIFDLEYRYMYYQEGRITRSFDNVPVLK